MPQCWALRSSPKAAKGYEHWYLNNGWVKILVCKTPTIADRVERKSIYSWPSSWHSTAFIFLMNVEEIVGMEFVVVFLGLCRCADMILTELVGDQSILSGVNCKGMSCRGEWSITAWPCCSCGSFWLFLKLSISTNTWQVFIQYLCSAVFNKLLIMAVTVIKKKNAFCIQCSQLSLPNFLGAFPCIRNDYIYPWYLYSDLVYLSLTTLNF